MPGQDRDLSCDVLVVTSAIYVAKRLASHIKDLVLYSRGVKITSGNALAARLAKTVFDLRIPLLTATPAQRLVTENGAVTGVVVRDARGEYSIVARRAVVLASGGFPHDAARVARAYGLPPGSRVVIDLLGRLDLVRCTARTAPRRLSGKFVLLNTHLGRPRRRGASGWRCRRRRCGLSGASPCRIARPAAASGGCRLGVAFLGECVATTCPPRPACRLQSSTNDSDPIAVDTIAAAQGRRQNYRNLGNSYRRRLPHLHTG